MDAMQKKLMKTLKGLRDDGIDLSETPVLFTWRYPEEPWIEFALQITEVEHSEFPTNEELH